MEQQVGDYRICVNDITGMFKLQKFTAKYCGNKCIFVWSDVQSSSNEQVEYPTFDFAFRHMKKKIKEHEKIKEEKIIQFEIENAWKAIEVNEGRDWRIME